MTAPNVTPDVEADAVFDSNGPRLVLLVDVDNAPAAANCRLFARNPETHKRFVLTKNPEWVDLRTDTPVTRELPFDVDRIDGLQLVCEGSIMLGGNPTPDVRFEVQQGSQRLGRITFPDGDGSTDPFASFFLVFNLVAGA